ncbi:MAG: DUF1801 domain-containing protein [Bryobacteraceae bacterium]|jgi:uncharacterized protein YdhG (YjbR/CyaY superfamily)
MKPGVPKNVDEYLAAVPQPARGTLKKIRATIRSIVPAETIETIGYRIPTFNYKGPLFGFAAFPNHCSLFPMSGTLTLAFMDELKNFQASKGTIRLLVDKPPPAALIKKLVKARVIGNESRQNESRQNERKKQRRLA